MSAGRLPGPAAAVLRQLHARGALTPREVETIASNYTGGGDTFTAAAIAGQLAPQAHWISPGGGAPPLLAATEEIELYMAPGAPLSRRARVFLKANEGRLVSSKKPAAHAPAALNPRPIEADDLPGGARSGRVCIVGGSFVIDATPLPPPPGGRAAAAARWEQALLQER